MNSLNGSGSSPVMMMMGPWSLVYQVMSSLKWCGETLAVTSRWPIDSHANAPSAYPRLAPIVEPTAASVE